MHDIEISPAGVAKLLSNLNVAKAADPHAIRPIQGLSQVIAPAVTVIFQILYKLQVHGVQGKTLR